MRYILIVADVGPYGTIGNFAIQYRLNLFAVVMTGIVVGGCGIGDFMLTRIGNHVYL